MSKKKRISIIEVAEAAGVSRQTVSRVLNNRPDVAPVTRTRVKDVIQTLSYKPSALARTLSQGTSCTLGVIGYGLEFYGNSRVLSVIESQANNRGYSLALNLIHEPELNDVDHFIGELIAQHVVGIIWAVPHIGKNRDWLLSTIDRITTPIICVSMEPHPDLSVVEVDNFAGGRLATRHLISQGFQKIGVITGPSNWWASRQRLEGWKAAMKEARLVASMDWVIEGDWTAKSGYLGAAQLLKQTPQIEAIFAFNDPMALGVQKSAIHLGLELPGDLALVGYDNIPESEFYPTSLTTVRQGFTELGIMAMEEMERRIQEEQKETTSTPKNILIPPELIIRASSFREHSF